ncbi:plasmid mobilization protein [Paraburkholderia solisilvae]|uniref:Uncharacterized protein n=1 Tax=Paraburkholderia solisilvae TaxID=624376 RepID=A0A6J5DZ80_9BURK|nr:hypothetical protein [Paraburkholderia solisilvae]CAB3759007.1 hypothetical protein LMG29739_03048 [Paraburkholderia solisilvae]
MNKPSERIVVFVSPAQKRAIAATADELGISVSELMRRAVLNFGATSEQVKAASIVDRLRAPREPDALNAALQRVARSVKHNRDALPAGLKAANAVAQPAGEALRAAQRDSTAHDMTGVPALAPVPVPVVAPVDPLHALSALSAMEGATAAGDTGEAARAADAQAAAEAAARVAAAKAATLKKKAKSNTSASACDESPFIDPAEGTGRFA